jgi:hypothetical protein
MRVMISRMLSTHFAGSPIIWIMRSVLWGAKLEKILMRAPVFCKKGKDARGQRENDS